MSGTRIVSASSLAPLVGGVESRCPRCGARILSASEPCPRCSVHPDSREARTWIVPSAGWKMEVLRGAVYLPRAILFALRRPRLWPALGLPLLLNVIFVFLVSELLVPEITTWLRYMTTPDALAQWTGAYRVLRTIIVFLGWLVRASSFFVVPGITAWVLSTPPFRIIFGALDTFVSERVERHVLGLPEDRGASLERSVAGATLNALGLSALEVALYLVLTPIALVPLVGTFAWLLAPRVIFAGLDRLDPILVRKLYYPREQFALTWRHRHRLLGFGATTFFLMGTPGFNAVIFPLAAVAATLLYLDLDPK